MANDFFKYIKDYNNFISKLASNLYNELRYNKLQVVLIPAPEPKHYNHCIRVATNHNPAWYSDFYYSFQYNPERKEVLRTLKDISENKTNATCYFEVMKDLIVEFLLHGYDVGTHNEPESKEFKELHEILF